ncbi:MAG: hypothetical protein JWM19_900 [Actinomycetia bacterium]|nr:hypothetical protein [Actinomycetes bacterium]
MPASGRPLNYTTTIEPAKSAQECIAILGAHHAQAVGLTLDNGMPTGLDFVISTRWGPRRFALPVNVEGTKRVLEKAVKDGLIPLKYATLHQARKVSWRVLKMWLETQIALIEAGLIELDEVMLPWVYVNEKQTLLQSYGEQQMIEAGG